MAVIFLLPKVCVSISPDQAIESGVWGSSPDRSRWGVHGQNEFRVRDTESAIDIFIMKELIRDRIWLHQYPVRFGPIRLHSRMTVIRLSDGSLWIHSPAPLDRALARELEALGEVKHIVAPNASHHLNYADFVGYFSDATGYHSPGLCSKFATAGRYMVLDEGTEPWSKEITGRFIGGIPLIDETIFYHSSSRSLIVTDLLFNMEASEPVLYRWLARILGVYRRPRMSRTMRLMIADKRALAGSIRTLQQLEIDRIIPAHGEVIEGEGKRRRDPTLRE